MQAHAPPDLDVRLTDLDADHRVLSLDGPYAWELMGDLVGPEVIGVPEKRRPDLEKSGRAVRFRGVLGRGAGAEGRRAVAQNVLAWRRGRGPSSEVRCA
jgi:hypothetical protein